MSCLFYYVVVGFFTADMNDPTVLKISSDYYAMACANLNMALDTKDETDDMNETTLKTFRKLKLYIDLQWQNRKRWLTKDLYLLGLVGDLIRMLTKEQWQEFMNDSMELGEERFNEGNYLYICNMMKNLNTMVTKFCDCTKFNIMGFDDEEDLLIMFVMEE